MAESKHVFKSLVPQSLRIWVGRNILKRNIPDYWGGKRYCPTCKTQVRYFLPLHDFYRENMEKYGYIYKDAQPETLNAAEYLCPHCYGNDRDRLIVLYYDTLLKQQTGNRKYTFLDFAPGKSVDRFFRNHPALEYRTADLLIDGVDDKGINIEQMDAYRNEQFDFFTCSHVLEHVQDPAKALAELYRVLKKGGSGVLLVPIILGVENTQEDPTHITPEERWKHYGQDDHLRMFGRTDFMNLIKKAGFELECFEAGSLGKNSLYRHGISATSVLYIAHKK